MHIQKMTGKQDQQQIRDKHILKTLSVKKKKVQFLFIVVARAPLKKKCLKAIKQFYRNSLGFCAKRERLHACLIS